MQDAIFCPCGLAFLARTLYMQTMHGAIVCLHPGQIFAPVKSALPPSVAVVSNGLETVLSVDLLLCGVGPW